MSTNTPYITAYGTKTKVVLNCKDKSLTKQASKDECDINIIMNKYTKTGLISHAKQYQGEYKDFENIDFHAAMTAVADANSMFAEIPSDIRAKFDNDPGKFLRFATNKDNNEKMIEMGLLSPAEETIPVNVNVTNKTAEKAAETDTT